MGGHTSRRLRLNVRGQDDATCGATSLWMILDYLNCEVTHEGIVDLTNTSHEGANHEDLVHGALQTGATVFEKAGGGLDELAEFCRNGLPCLFGWWSIDETIADHAEHFSHDWSDEERSRRDCGHFSVVAGVSSSSVWIVDPQNDSEGRLVGNRKVPAPTFEEFWYDTDTADLILINRWYMVASFDRGLLRDIAPLGGILHSPT